MKLTPIVNFINILQAAFAPISFCQKIKRNMDVTSAGLTLAITLPRTNFDRVEFGPTGPG